MPKPGYKSLTVSNNAYERLNDSFLTIKDYLESKGVHSMSGYMSYLIEHQFIINEILGKHPPIFVEKLTSSTQIFVEDHQLNKVIELNIRKNTIFCTKCENTNCVHVGFCCSIPEVIRQMKGKIKL